MKTMNIDIPAEVGTNLDKLYFEVESRKQLIAFCVAQGTSYTAFMPEYVDLFVKLERAKVEFENTYLSDYPGRLKWSIIGGTQVRLEIADV